MARKRKRIWKQKTFWSGLAMIGAGVALCVKGNVAAGSQSVIGGLGLIFLRQAVEARSAEGE